MKYEPKKKISIKVSWRKFLTFALVAILVASIVWPKQTGTLVGKAYNHVVGGWSSGFKSAK